MLSRAGANRREDRQVVLRPPIRIEADDAVVAYGLQVVFDRALDERVRANLLGDPQHEEPERDRHRQEQAPREE